MNEWAACWSRAARRHRRTRLIKTKPPIRASSRLYPRAVNPPVASQLQLVGKIKPAASNWNGLNSRQRGIREIAMAIQGVVWPQLTRKRIKRSPNGDAL